MSKRLFLPVAAYQTRARYWAYLVASVLLAQCGWLGVARADSAQEPDLVPVVAQARGSVVGITLRPLASPSAKTADANNALAKLFDQIDEQDNKPKFASGVIISADGLILTSSSHFKVKGETEVFTDAGRRYPAKWLARDHYTGLALLKIDAQNLPVAKLSKSAILPGEAVLALGRSALSDAENMVVMNGMISSIDVKLRASRPAALQTTALLVPSMVGGPLLRVASGEVIGINSNHSTDLPQATMATPISQFLQIQDDLTRYGRVRRCALELSLVGDMDHLQRLFQVKDRKPAVINKLGPSAQAAGLKTGDVIVALDETEIKLGFEVDDFLQACRFGTVVKVGVMRGKERLVFSLPALERKESGAR